MEKKQTKRGKKRQVSAGLDQIKALANQIVTAGSLTAFTGAGISTESGIPDYRSQGGLRDRFRPIYFDEFMSSVSARIEYWNQGRKMEKNLIHARPNKGHMALARLEREGLLTAIITQNIDGLHQASGIPSKKIIELHGNSRRIRCMSCSRLTTWEEAIKRIALGDFAPECDCGGYLKPDTVSFGQPMPERETRKAERLSSQSRVFLTVGSMLQVQPAASMPEYARSTGAYLAIINLSTTSFDSRADLVIRDNAGLVLNTLADLICSDSPKF